jgi:hypothetical protein
VAALTPSALVLDLAEKWRTSIPWTCLEGIVPFISVRERVPIGSRYQTGGIEGTLDGYLKAYVNRATAAWIAAVLESAEIVEIDRRPPATVRRHPNLRWHRSQCEHGLLSWTAPDLRRGEQKTASLCVGRYLSDPCSTGKQTNDLCVPGLWHLGSVSRNLCAKDLSVLSPGS